MKKFNFFLSALAIISLTFFSSCAEEDEPNPPSIIITVDGNATFEPGSTVVYSLTISSNADLESFSSNETTQSNPIAMIENILPMDAFDDALTLEFKNGLTSVSFNYAYNIPSTVAPGTTIDITFTVIDADTEGSKTESFQVAQPIVAGNINTYTAVLIGANANPTLGSFYATASNTVYSVSQAASNSASVDFVYFYGATNLATIASPDDADVTSVFPSVSGWATRNATRLVKSDITTSDFDAIADDAVIIEQAANISNGTKVNDLAVGDVFVFETVGSKFGIAKVSALTNGNDGSITIEVKVQE